MNLSLVYPKIDSYYQAVSSASCAIELDPKNEKAFFRRAQAQMALSEFEAAKNDFKTVVEINSVSKLYLCIIFMYRSMIIVPRKKFQKLSWVFY